MKTLEYKNRKAFSVSIEKLLIIGIALVAVAAVAAFGGDLVGTATVVDSLELSKQTLYSDQEFVSVTVKNGGTTPITNIQAYVLIADATGTSGISADCATGADKALISTSTTRLASTLNPGESATISGNLYTDATTLVDIDCSDNTVTAGLVTSVNDIEDRTEYIIQVEGEGEGDDTISSTTTVRSR